MDTQIIKGSTRLIALLGDPVAHSLSPAIHNHALRRLGLDMAYVPLRVASADLEACVESLCALGFVGANVTVPHKQQAMGCCDTVSELSRNIGAVNTLSFSNGRVHGTSTDTAGFFRALQWMGHDPAGGDIVILGNGGTARTLAFALAMHSRPSSLTILGRDGAKARALAADVREQTGLAVEADAFASAMTRSILDTCTLCVNCTSAGMHPDVAISPLDTERFTNRTTVFDTIYNPAQTLFLRQAQEAGCAVQNGLRMLLYQALESLKIWTGADVPESLFDINELEATINNRP